MEAPQVAQLLTNRFGSSIVEIKTDARLPWAKIDPAKIVEVVQFLRDTPELQFDFLRSLAAVDYINDKQIELVYLLFSYPHRHAFCLKVRLPRENPRVGSIEKVWPAAQWHEREAYDLLGVEFEGNSDLRRILLPDDWIGHPLRKDFREQEEYHGVSTNREYLTGMPDIPTRKPLPVAGNQ